MNNNTTQVSIYDIPIISKISYKIDHQSKKLSKSLTRLRFLNMSEEKSEKFEKKKRYLKTKISNSEANIDSLNKQLQKEITNILNTPYEVRKKDRLNAKMIDLLYEKVGNKAFQSLKKEALEEISIEDM